MVAGKNCSYSLTKPGEEQFESFIWHTGGHVVAAAALNGIALYLIGAEDVVPGIIIGGAVGLSVNLAHKTAHLVGIEDKNGCYLPKRLDIVLVALLTYEVARDLLRVFEYRIGTGKIIKLGVAAIATIAAVNKYQKGME